MYGSSPSLPAHICCRTPVVDLTRRKSIWSNLIPGRLALPLRAYHWRVDVTPDRRQFRGSRTTLTVTAYRLQPDALRLDVRESRDSTDPLSGRGSDPIRRASRVCFRAVALGKGGNDVSRPRTGSVSGRPIPNSCAGMAKTQRFFSRTTPRISSRCVERSITVEVLYPVLASSNTAQVG